MAPMTGTVITDWKVDLSTANYASKRLLVIGGTNGLGRALALHAASQQVPVTVVGRSFQDEDVAGITFVQADLSSMKECQKIGETIEPADVVLFTAGIVPFPERKVSPDDIEMDMAVSYLSRLVILNFLRPRLPPKARVFIMGFPGANAKGNLDDLNSEQSYDGSVPGFVHMNTIMGNEALVLESARKEQGSITYYGLNPGLIKTGIRSNAYQAGWLKYFGGALEFLVGLFSTSPEGYATVITPLLFVPALDEHTGALFNPKAEPIETSQIFREDGEFAAKFIEASKALVTKKTGIQFT